MTFAEPVSWAEAVEELTRKGVLPTTMTHVQLRALAEKIHQRAFVSAQIAKADVLQELKDLALAMLSPEKVTRTLLDGSTVEVWSGMDRGRARLLLRDFVAGTDYRPAGPGIQDIRSESRLNLIFDTQTKLAYGFGRFQEGQSETILDLWPAQELFRAEDRKVPREWQERWEAAGGELIGERMVARKDDEIWQALGDGEGGYDDTLGNPYPPFAFNSGMDVKDIDRAEAVELGVIDEDETVKPQEGESEVPISTEHLDEDIKAAVEDALGIEADEDGEIQTRETVAK